MQSYMEDHLKNKDRLNREWEGLLSYEADPSSTAAALLPKNRSKNRYIDILPYDHSRVILNDLSNCSKSDYINANTIVSLTYSHICFSPMCCMRSDGRGICLLRWQRIAASPAILHSHHLCTVQIPAAASFSRLPPAAIKRDNNTKDHWEDLGMHPDSLSDGSANVRAKMGV